MKTYTWILLLAFVLSLAVVGFVGANNETMMMREAMANGATNSTSSNITLQATLGQPIVGLVSSGEVTLGQGFWYDGNLNGQENTVYLPLITQ